MKTLHLRLTYHWYDEIESGRKKIDYREVKRYWTERLTPNVPGLEGQFKEFGQIIFYRAYSSAKMCKNWIKTEELETGIDTDLKTEKPVYAIYFK